MNANDRQKPGFWGHPTPKQASDIPYCNDAGSNPVLRGLPLAVAARMYVDEKSYPIPPETALPPSHSRDELTCYSISSSTWVQKFFWKLNKFDKLKELPGLDDYEARHDPTVSPIVQSPLDEKVSLAELPTPRPRPSSNSSHGYYTATDYHSLYKSGTLTPTDVANTLLPLIRRDSSSAGPHSIAFLESQVDLVKRAAEA